MTKMIKDLKFKLHEERVQELDMFNLQKRRLRGHVTSFELLKEDRGKSFVPCPREQGRRQ